MLGERGFKDSALGVTREETTKLEKFYGNNSGFSEWNVPGVQREVVRVG